MTDEQSSDQGGSLRHKDRRDSLSAFIWALIFIWAGVVLLAENLGYLGWLKIRFSDLPAGLRQFGVEAWPLIFLGAGVLVAIEVLLRLVVPAFRRPVTGRIILAVILVGVGLGNLTNWNVLWPLILIVLGVSMLLGGFFRNR
jgi:hypothetical protein